MSIERPDLQKKGGGYSTVYQSQLEFPMLKLRSPTVHATQRILEKIQFIFIYLSACQNLS